MTPHTMCDKLKEIREKLKAAIEAHEVVLGELHQVMALLGDCADDDASP